MIYIVEIPHQSAPSVWVADDEDGMVVRVSNYIEKMGKDWQEVYTFQDAKDYIRHDAHGVAVYMSDDEALAGFMTGDKLPMHQLGKSSWALRQALIETGALNSYGMTPAAQQLADALCGEAGIDDAGDWLDGLSRESWDALNNAANGSVADLAYMRGKAGLPAVV